MDAVLWDMDGLLVDTEPLWTQAQQELAAGLGRVFSPEAKAAVVGTRLDRAVPALLHHLRVPAGPEQVERASTWLLGRMVELFRGPLPPRPGAPRLLAALRSEGVPQALVSSSYRVLVDAVLATGVGPFDLTLAGDEVGSAKPHPEPYLTAAAGLGVAPERCVVLEDSTAGVAAGEAAGAAVVWVPQGATVAVAGRRRAVVGSLEDVDVALLRALAAPA